MSARGKKNKSHGFLHSNHYKRVPGNGRSTPAYLGGTARQPCGGGGGGGGGRVGTSGNANEEYDSVKVCWCTLVVVKIPYYEKPVRTLSSTFIDRVPPNRG